MNTPPIAVLQIIATGPAFGGGSRHVYDLATRLTSLNVHSTIVAPLERQGTLLQMLKQANIPTIPLAMNSAFDQVAAQQLQHTLQNWSREHEASPKLVHIHGFRAGILARNALGKLAQELAIPIVYTEHLMTNDYRLPNPVRQWFQQRYLRQVDKVTQRTIAVSQAVRQFLLDKQITKAEKIVVIPNGVDMPQSPDTPKQREAGYHIGMLGSLVRLKAHADVIRALPLIAQNIPKLTLHIAGDGPLRTELEKLSQKIGVDAMIRWHGYVENPRPLMAGWDLLISASTSESFGLGIAEAMCEGVPVIATKVGAVPELVTPDVGRLVPVHDPHEIAKAVIDLLPRGELRKTMGAAARKRITTQFSLDQMVDKTANLYRELAKPTTMRL